MEQNATTDAHASVADLKKGDKIAVHDLDGKVRHITILSAEPNGEGGFCITPARSEA